MVRRTLLAIVLTAFAFPVWSQDAIEEAARLQHLANAARTSKDYTAAAALMLQSFNLDRNETSRAYSAAAIYALDGKRAQALNTLEVALDAGYMDAQAIVADEDFATLRGDARFQSLMDKMAARRNFDARLYDSPALATPFQENLSENEKIAGLSKFWSEVKYNFVFVDKLKDIDWDRLYLQYIPKVRATRSTGEYYKVLMELCARLKDGHTNVYPPREVYDSLFASPMLRTHLVEGRVLVRQLFDPELAARGIVPGMEVIAVNGRPVQEYAMHELAPYASSSTPQDLERRIYTYNFLAGPIGEAPLVVFRGADGKTVEARARRVPFDALRKASPKRPPFEFRMLPGNVAYVALNGFDNSRGVDAYLEAFDQVARSSALVIDLRNNGGGDSETGYRALATLTDKPFATNRWETRQYRPSWRAWQRPQANYTQTEPKWPADPVRKYRKPVAVLTGSGTFSAAEDFLVAYDSMKRGIIVGEPTGGSTGMPLMVTLPGGGMARIVTKADTYPDGRQWVGVGIQPTLRVAPAVADSREGRDTVLEAALAALRARENER